MLKVTDRQFIPEASFPSKPGLVKLLWNSKSQALDIENMGRWL
jgi:hypothetical protein